MANIKDLLGDAYHEGMTNDEIVAALDGVQLPQDRTDEIDRLIKAKDKANSEAAEYKRQLKAHMSDEEKRATEEAEKYQKMEQENEILRKQIAVSDLTSKYIASGLDAETAAKTAEASYSGDFDTIIANYSTMIANVKAKAVADTKAEMMATNPVMKGGQTGQVKDYSASIESSLANGDYASAAALMREQQTQNINK